MDFNYNKIFEEIKRYSHKNTCLWIGICATLSALTIILCACHILPSHALWTIIWLIPAMLIMFLHHVYYRQYIQTLCDKQQLLIMTAKANQPLSSVNDDNLTDTYVTDCYIKMRYLSKNGIEIDEALERLGGNINTYNELAVSFINECNTIEDELFNLIHTSDFIKYGTKAHMFRQKTNQLGLRNLTDTVFFHEIEALAGNHEIVQSNWEKLSFEIDEAHYIFSEYIKSIGLKDYGIKK